MGQYNQDYSGFDTQGSSSFDQPPQNKSSRTIMIVVGVLLVLCCLCVVCSLVFYFFLGDVLTDSMGITQLMPNVLYSM